MRLEIVTTLVLGLAVLEIQAKNIHKKGLEHGHVCQICEQHSLSSGGGTGFEVKDNRPDYCFKYQIKWGGDCDDNPQRWYYNFRKGYCELRDKPVCHMNENNFGSERSCEGICGKEGDNVVRIDGSGDGHEHSWTSWSSGSFGGGRKPSYCYKYSYESGTKCKERPTLWIYNFRSRRCEKKKNTCTSTRNSFSSHVECMKACGGNRRSSGGNNGAWNSGNGGIRGSDGGRSRVEGGSSGGNGGNIRGVAMGNGGSSGGASGGNGGSSSGVSGSNGGNSRGNGDSSGGVSRGNSGGISRGNGGTSGGVKGGNGGNHGENGGTGGGVKGRNGGRGNSGRNGGSSGGKRGTSGSVNGGNGGNSGVFSEGNGGSRSSGGQGRGNGGNSRGFNGGNVIIDHNWSERESGAKNVIRDKRPRYCFKYSIRLGGSCKNKPLRWYYNFPK